MRDLSDDEPSWFAKLSSSLSSLPGAWVTTQSELLAHHLQAPPFKTHWWLSGGRWCCSRRAGGVWVPWLEAEAPRNRGLSLWAGICILVHSAWLRQVLASDPHYPDNSEALSRAFI